MILTNLEKIDSIYNILDSLKSDIENYPNSVYDWDRVGKDILEIVHSKTKYDNNGNQEV